ncbi:unnamed protein product [Aphanomyces euteiches]
MQNNMSTWEKAARAQLYHKQKAIQENELLHRQYTRLDTVLINAGLFGVKDSIACVRPKTNSDGKGLYVEQIYCVNLDAPRENIINAIWSFCKDGQLQCPLPSDAQQVHLHSSLPV